MQRLRLLRLRLRLWLSLRLRIWLRLSEKKCNKRKINFILQNKIKQIHSVDIK
jgi:hypothetical protein